jgi:hypothetical protein
VRFVRTMTIVAGAILALTVSTLWVSTPGASASSTLHELHIAKNCSTDTGIPPTFCTIAASNFRALPVHAKVWYLGPVLSNAYFLSSNIKIDAWHGNTTTGYCQVDARDSSGICTFWKGTGTLTGFHAVLHVTIDSKGLWHWDGSYYFPGKS